MPSWIENRKYLLLAAVRPIAGSYDAKHCVAFSTLIQSEFQIEMNIFLSKDLNKIVVSMMQPYEAVYSKALA
jgi:hypothetical protein